MIANFKPQKIRWLEKKSEFSILWGNDHESIFPLLYLREECPCALCRWERENKDPLKMAKILPENLNAIMIETVGHYAIKIQWNDGHSTGIYTFDMLRNLCLCAQCKQVE